MCVCVCVCMYACMCVCMCVCVCVGVGAATAGEDDAACTFSDVIRETQSLRVLDLRQNGDIGYRAAFKLGQVGAVDQ